MIPNITDTTENRQTLLLETFKRVLQPLVRMLLKNSIQYNMLLEQLKQVYVNIADSEFKIGDKPQTDSRITLLTGVHRKDVHRIRFEKQKNTYKPQRASLSSEIMAVWLGNPIYFNKEGQPDALPRLSSVGGERSFEALVASVSKDFRARPVLDEWLRLGVVKLDENDYVCLNQEAFLPDQTLEQKLFFMRMNIHDHMAATVNNLDDNRTPMLERCVYYDGLSKESVEKLHLIAKQVGMSAIQQMNKHAAEVRASQGKEELPNQRMNFGAYYYHEKNESHTD